MVVRPIKLLMLEPLFFLQYKFYQPLFCLSFSCCLYIKPVKLDFLVFCCRCSCKYICLIPDYLWKVLKLMILISMFVTLGKFKRTFFIGWSFLLRLWRRQSFTNVSVTRVQILFSALFDKLLDKESHHARIRFHFFSSLDRNLEEQTRALKNEWLWELRHPDPFVFIKPAWKRKKWHSRF